MMLLRISIALALGAVTMAQGIPVAAGGAPINVEIDYMVGADGHSHMPQPEELLALEQMFACQGITLNLVVDDAITETPIMRCPNIGDPFWTCIGLESFFAIKSANFDNGPFGWHYCIFGHDYDDGDGTGSSGLGQLPGENFIVTLGSWPNQIGSAFDRASTLAHELGHNLGLRHTSPSSTFASGNYAPNYASVMSYQYQLSGVKTQMQCLGLIDIAHLYKDLDYSSGRMPKLNESSLSESIGAGMHSVDWNCDGSIGGTISKNIDFDSPWCGFGGGISTLDDWNDWANLVDTAYAPLPIGSSERVRCITYEEARRMGAVSRENAGAGTPAPDDCPGGQATLSVEACNSGQMSYVTPSFALLQTGTGELPYYGIDTAQTNSPAGSVLYLQPGIAHGAVNGSSLLLTKPLIWSAPSSVLIDP